MHNAQTHVNIGTEKTHTRQYSQEETPINKDVERRQRDAQLHRQTTDRLKNKYTQQDQIYSQIHRNIQTYTYTN